VLPKITVEGRITNDPELRFTQSGDAVASFTVVSQDRKKGQDGKWEDAGEPMFLRVSVWRQYAENVAESLTKGDSVIVSGKLMQRSYQDREGAKRTSFEIQADEVAVPLRFRTVRHGEGRAERGGQQRQQQPSDDPWASTAPAGGGDPWAPPQDPPFHHDPRHNHTMA
jgi:single-strand DNA-binding protein